MAAEKIKERQEYTFKASRWSSHSQILQQIPSHGEGLRVLDVGCWNGLLAGRLAAQGYEVTGIERERWDAEVFPEGVRLIHADLHFGLPQLPDQFDVVICADVLEHLLDPALVLRQLRERLVPGGKLIASLPNSGNFYFRAIVASGRFPKEDKGLFDRTHLHFHPWSGWTALLQSSGYTIENVSATPVPFSLLCGEDSMWGRAIEWLFLQLAKGWKTLFAYQFVVTARRD